MVADLPKKDEPAGPGNGNGVVLCIVLCCNGVVLYCIVCIVANVLSRMYKRVWV